MGLLVRFVYRHRGCITEGLSDSDFVTRISADRHCELVLMQGATPERTAALAAAFRAYSKGPLEVLCQGEGAVLFRSSNPPDDVVEALDDNDCTLLLPTVYTGGVERFDVVAPDAAAALRLRDALERHGEVVSFVPVEVPIDELAPVFRAADLTGDLTPRQLEVLLAAAAGGYYNSPRGTTAARLAAEEGSARTTLEEHLRKAENNLLARFAALLAPYPFRARVARRGVGRPRRRINGEQTWQSAGLRR